MNTRGFLSLASVLLAIAATNCAIPPAPPAQPPSDDTPANASAAFSDDADPALAELPFVNDELLVQTMPGAEAGESEAAYRLANATVRVTLPEIDLTVLSVDPAEREAAADMLQAAGLFENIQKNYVLQASRTPNDAQFPDQDHLPIIEALAAWDRTVGSADVVIGIVDTGVDGDHPDLAAKIAGGWNVYDNNADYSDVMGHGTAVAGVAAAMSNNASGVTGVAWNCPILAVRAADADGGSTGRHLAAGILWAVANGAKVINVSFAPLQSNSMVKSAVQYAYNRGCLVVMAAGNSGQVFSAAGYDEGVFVGATDSFDVVTSFSDKGPYVDLTAPGLDVLTTGNGGVYEFASGTSFSSPVVAGVAALAWSANPDLRPVSIIDALMTTARDLGSRGKDQTYGYGRVAARAAVEKAAATAVAPDTTPPTISLTKPSAGSSQSKRFTVSVSATDRTGVADVVLSVDNIALAADTRSPYSFTVEPSRYSPAQHTLSAVATDLVGNRSTTASVTVSFAAAAAAGASRITFTSPAAGATVTGNTTIAAQVSNASGLTAAEWFIDGKSVLLVPISGASTSLNYLWRAGTATTGSHAVALVVTDQTGATTTANLSLTKR